MRTDILKNRSLSIYINQNFQNIFIIEFISNDPTQNDWEGFKSVLQKIYSSEIIFGLIMDFTTLKNSGLLCFNKALDVLLFFKKNKEKSKDFLIGTSMVNHNNTVNNFINTLLYFYSPARPLEFVSSIQNAYNFLEDLSKDFRNGLRVNNLSNPFVSNIIAENNNDASKNNKNDDKNDQKEENKLEYEQDFSFYD